MLKLIVVALGLANICVGIAVAAAGIFDRENLIWPWSENLFMATLPGLVIIAGGICACIFDPITVLRITCFGYWHSPRKPPKRWRIGRDENADVYDVESNT